MRARRARWRKAPVCVSLPGGVCSAVGQRGWPRPKRGEGPTTAPIFRTVEPSSTYFGLTDARDLPYVHDGNSEIFRS